MQIAHQYAAFYIQRKLTYNVVRAQHIENQLLTQNAKYCDICGQTLSCAKILDSRIRCFVNYLDKTTLPHWTRHGASQHSTWLQWGHTFLRLALEISQFLQALLYLCHLLGMSAQLPFGKEEAEQQGEQRKG